MKKLIALIALTTLLIPNLTSAQDASTTNSALKTGVWEGKFMFFGNGDSATKLNVDSISGKHVKAQVNFIDRQNSIVELSGDIAESFGDFVEQSRWQFVIKDKKFKDGTWIKLTEVKLIQGYSDLKTTYYGFLTDNTLVGCFFNANNPQPVGRFELRAPEQ